MARTKKVACPKCGELKAAAEFYPWSKQGGGEGRSHHCRQCEADRQRAKRAKKPTKKR